MGKLIEFAIRFNRRNGQINLTPRKKELDLKTLDRLGKFKKAWGKLEDFE